MGYLAGAAEFTSMWGHDQYVRDYVAELGLPWEHREVWDRVAPFWDELKRSRNSKFFVHIHQFRAKLLPSFGFDIVSHDRTCARSIWPKPDKWNSLDPRGSQGQQQQLLSGRSACFRLDHRRGYPTIPTRSSSLQVRPAIMRGTEIDKFLQFSDESRTTLACGDCGNGGRPYLFRHT